MLRATCTSILQHCIAILQYCSQNNIRFGSNKTKQQPHMFLRTCPRSYLHARYQNPIHASRVCPGVTRHMSFERPRRAEHDDVISLSVTFKDKEISPFFVSHYIFKMGSRDTFERSRRAEHDDVISLSVTSKDKEIFLFSYLIKYSK